MLEYQLMREFPRSRFSRRPKESLFSRAFEALSRLLEKVLPIQKSRKGNRILTRKLEGPKSIKPKYIRPPEKLPPPKRVPAYRLGPNGKIKPYKGNPFKKRNR